MSRFNPTPLPRATGDQESLRPLRSPGTGAVRFSPGRDKVEITEVLDSLTNVLRTKTRADRQEEARQRAELRDQNAAFNDAIEVNGLSAQREFFTSTKDLDRGTPEGQAAYRESVQTFQNSIADLEGQEGISTSNRAKLQSLFIQSDEDQRRGEDKYAKTLANAAELLVNQQVESSVGTVSSFMADPQTVQTIAVISSEVPPTDRMRVTYNKVFSTYQSGVRDFLEGQGASDEEIIILMSSDRYIAERDKAITTTMNDVQIEVSNMRKARIDSNFETMGQFAGTAIFTEGTPAGTGLDFLGAPEGTEPFDIDAVIEDLPANRKEDFISTAGASMRTTFLNKEVVPSVDNVLKILSFHSRYNLADSQLPDELAGTIGDMIRDVDFSNTIGTPFEFVEQFKQDIIDAGRAAGTTESLLTETEASFLEAMDNLLPEAFIISQFNSTKGLSDFFGSIDSGNVDEAIPVLLKQLENQQVFITEEMAGKLARAHLASIDSDLVTSKTTLQLNGPVYEAAAEVYAQAVNSGLNLGPDMLGYFTTGLLAGSAEEHVAALTFFRKSPTATTALFATGLSVVEKTQLELLITAEDIPSLAVTDINTRRNSIAEMSKVSDPGNWAGVSQEKLDEIKRSGFAQIFGKNTAISDRSKAVVYAAMAVWRQTNPDGSPEAAFVAVRPVMDAMPMIRVGGTVSIVHDLMNEADENIPTNSQNDQTAESLTEALRRDESESYFVKPEIVIESVHSSEALLNTSRRAVEFNRPDRSSSYTRNIRVPVNTFINREDRVNIVTDNLFETSSISNQFSALNFAANEEESANTLLRTMVEQVYSGSGFEIYNSDLTVGTDSVVLAFDFADINDSTKEVVIHRIPIIMDRVSLNIMLQGASFGTEPREVTRAEARELRKTDAQREELKRIQALPAGSFVTDSRGKPIR